MLVTLQLAKPHMILKQYLIHSKYSITVIIIAIIGEGRKKPTNLCFRIAQ